MWKKLCRLCSTSEDLLWVLDPKMASDNVVQIVETMCGVKISNTDTVSQMVCRTCCQVTIKMHQFRLKAIKNDEDLKARYAAFLVQKSNDSKPKLNVHFSVREVMKKHPKVKLPKECLQSHVGAYITLMSDEIDDYLEEHNLTYEDIGRYKTSIPKCASSSAEKNRKRPRVSSGKKAVGPASKKAPSGGQHACKRPVNTGKKVVAPDCKEEKPYASFVIRVVGPAVEDLPVDEKLDPNNAPANTLLDSWLGYQRKENKKPEEMAKNAAPQDTSRQITLTSLLASQPQKLPADNADTSNFMEFFSSRPFLDSKDQEVHVVEEDDDDVILVSHESSKSSFVEALQLAPSNQPDLSLVSVAKKSHTLYICKICGSQHSSSREMRIHERRTHTKCPFCHRHFRTFIARAQHLITCTMAPLKMKLARLALVRVDEDPEVRKKFPSAFPKLKPIVHEEEIVCVDDKETPQRTYNVVNSDIVKNINSHDNDLTVLKKILTASQKDKKMAIAHDFSDCPIVDGETPRVKVFKNLRKYLNTIRIPIEVECGAGLTVEYKKRPPPPKRLVRGSWSHMVTKRLEPFDLPPHLLPLPSQQPNPFPLNENKKEGGAITKKKTAGKKKNVKPLEPVAPMVPTFFLAPISMGPSANEAASTNPVNYVLVPAVQTATSAGSPVFSAALSTSFTSSPGMSMNSFSSPVTGAPQMNSFTTSPIISGSGVPSVPINSSASSPSISAETQVQTDSFSSSLPGASSVSQVINVPSSPITSTLPQVSLGNLPIISAVSSMAPDPMTSFTSSPLISGVSQTDSVTSSPITISLGTLPIISSVSSMALAATDSPDLVIKSENSPTDETVAQLASITDALMPASESVGINGGVAEIPTIRVKNVQELL